MASQRWAALAVLSLLLIMYMPRAWAQEQVPVAPVEKSSAETSDTAEADAPVKYAPIIDKSAERSSIFSPREPTPTEKVEANSTSGGALLWLIAVVLLLGGLLWGGMAFIKKFLPGGKNLFSSPAIEVLGRTHLDSRRYMAMVRFGRRLLLVAVAQDGMTLLSEISEESEIAEAMAMAKPKTDAGRSLFQNLFKRQAAVVDSAQADGEAEAVASGVQDALGSLRERVRSLHTGDKDA